MEKLYDVTALGELLIDFTMNGYSEQGNRLFEANPGGAPGNVLALLAKMDKKTAFIGKVGNDQFGALLKETLEAAGIDHHAVYMDASYNTTLAFVHTMPDGDRDFSFYRKPGADMMLEVKDIPEDVIAASKIFHFGSLSFTAEPVRSASKKAIAMAKNHGLLISFDPNLRPPLWETVEEAKEQIAYGLGQCDILKISEDELEFMTGKTDITEGAAQLREQYTIKLLNVTAGKIGSYSFYKDEQIFCPGVTANDVIETTGAGDTFCGSVLNYVLNHDIENLTKDELKEMLQFGNAAAYLVTTKKGAICSMPEKAKVEAVIKKQY